MLADRAYSTYEIVESLKVKGATVCIPTKSNMKIIWDYDKNLYKSQNKIERFFHNLKNSHSLRQIGQQFSQLCVLSLDTFMVKIVCRHSLVVEHSSSVRLEKSEESIGNGKKFSTCFNVRFDLGGIRPQTRQASSRGGSSFNFRVNVLFATSLQFRR